MFVSRSVLAFALVTILLIPHQACADQAGDVEAAIYGFYGELAAAQFDKAFGRMQLGARGYIPFGVLSEIPNEEVRKMVIESYKEDFEAGELSLSPRYIKVTIHGTTAVSTFLAQGKIHDPDEDETRHVLQRVSLIWTKTDEGWKMIHWHASDVKTSPND